MPPKLLFLLRRQIGIPRWADDAAGSDCTEGADFLGHRNHGADLGDRNLQFFDFFADRCAAASAGASGGGEDHARDAGGFQSLSNVLAYTRGVLDGSVGAAGGMNKFVELADDMIALQFAQSIDRHQSVRITVGKSGVLTRVNGIVFVGFEGIHPGNRNRREAGRSAGLDLVRVAFKHQAAVGDQSDDR